MKSQKKENNVRIIKCKYCGKEYELSRFTPSPSVGFRSKREMLLEQAQAEEAYRKKKKAQAKLRGHDLIDVAYLPEQGSFKCRHCGCIIKVPDDL